MRMCSSRAATVEATGGSVFNINAVLAGDLEFGIAQSDRQFQAYNGLAEWLAMMFRIMSATACSPAQVSRFRSISKSVPVTSMPG